MPRPDLATLKSLASGAALLVLGAGCERPMQGKAGAADAAGPAVPRVEVVRVERRTVRRTVGEPGQLQAFETTPIHARIAGYVREWTVNIGSEVKKGQVLAELAVPEVEAERDQKRAAVRQATARHTQAGAMVKVAEAAVAGAEAKLAEARAGVARADADLARWRAESERADQLFRDRAQTGSLRDETRNKLRSAEATRAEVLAQVKTAEAGLVQGRAGLDQARSDVGAAAAGIEFAREDARRVDALLGFARIVAPYDGVITRRNAETGDLTQPGAATPPLFIVARIDPVTITLDVPETFATAVGPGDPVEVKLQAMAGRTIRGKVTRTAWALDPATRTIRVEVDVPNPGGTLRPGLYAYATVVAEEHVDVPTLPATAVVTEADRSYCVAVIGGKAVRRPIVVGLGDGTRTEVVSGLGAGEAVVKANAAAIADGQAVQISEPANPPQGPAKP